ncbi:UNVERIFIED_CONTAM: Enzymatic polyprotein [Sesamum indicum]
MDLQPSQNNYNEGDRLQTSESLSGFFSRMTVSNKTMERIMRQDSNLSPYDGFRIGGIGKILNQIGLNQRKHHIIYKVSSGEFAIPMELTGNVMEMQLIPKEEILEELSKHREEVAVTMKWIHIGTIEVVIKTTFKEGIDSEIHLSIMDRRINNLRDGCLGTMIGNLYAGKLMFDIHPRIAYNLADQDFSRVLTLHQDFKRKDLIREGNRPYSITYRIAYALSNTHHSDLFLRKEYIEIPRIFKEFAKQPVVGRYEGMLEIAGHEILVAGVAGRENGSMTLGLSFLEDHKPLGRKAYIDSGSGICTAKPGVFPKEARKTLPVIAGRDFSQKILILNKGIREAKIIIGGAFGSPWFRVKTPPIYFHDTGADILLGNNFIQTFARYMQDNQRNLLIFTTNCGSEIQVLRKEKAFNRIMPINFCSKCGDFDAKLTYPKMQDKRKFGKVLLSFRQQGLIDSDSFYKESEEEILNLKETLLGMKALDISEESRLSLENVKRLIQRNFSENPLAWWDRNKIEATLKVKDECKYEYVRYKPIQMNMEDNSPGFLVRNHGEIKRGKPRLVINYQGINKILEFDGYYIPSREHLIDCIKEAKVFSKFDCKSGFYQIKMESESKKFTAFSTPQGQYIWNVLPMGLANAPQIFQRKMDNLFKDYFEFMFVYIDDILIASKNMKEHIRHLEIFSDACYREGLVLSEKKATIAVNKIEFLGILIDKTGIELQDHIVEKIRNFPDILKDKKQLQSFLGVVNFAGIFIKDLARYRKDFRPLLKEMESSKWKWEEIHTKRVRELKQVCSNLSKLAIPQDGDDLVVYTDANDYRWAAVLMKWTTTGEEPCRYTGGLFSEQQAKVWHINEKEFFAGSTPIASDSSTDCTRPSPDSGETATIESQEVQTPVDSSQPNTSGVKDGEISLRPMTGTSKANTNELISCSAWQDYQRMWEKLISRKGVNPGKTIIKTSGKYNRVWMLEGSKPEDVREWYDFGALASVHTMSPSFSELSKLPEWISGAVFDSWQNNPHLKRGDVLEIKFVSVAPETAGKGSHPAFHFMKLQRPDMVAFNKIKAASGEAPLVSTISEDNISTRRAWGLWVCLTEMDKVKYPFKIFSNKVNGSFLLNSMTGKNTEFAESLFEKKRMLIWENKLPATEVTRMKTCNMLHVLCPCCEKQEKPLFGTKIRVTKNKPEPDQDKGKRKIFTKRSKS